MLSKGVQSWSWRVSRVLLQHTCQELSNEPEDIDSDSGRGGGGGGGGSCVLIIRESDL